MSISIGGGAIWSMHFTGMSALKIQSNNNNENNHHKYIPISFNIGTTVLSLIAAIVCVYIGLFISTRDRVYTKDKEEVFEMLSNDTQNLSIKSIQNKSTLYRLAFLKGINHLAIGGIITGSGVCVMHYIGMFALSANVIIEWNIGLIILSVIIAIVASTAAFWILFRLLPLFPNYESLRLISSFIMAIAVCGMHYTGMLAATYHYEVLEEEEEEEDNHSSNGMYVGKATMNSKIAGFVAIISSLILNWLFSTIIQSELRYISFTRTRQYHSNQKSLLQLYEKYPHENISNHSASNSKSLELQLYGLKSPRLDNVLSIDYALPKFPGYGLISSPTGSGSIKNSGKVSNKGISSSTIVPITNSDLVVDHKSCDEVIEFNPPVISSSFSSSPSPIDSLVKFDQSNLLYDMEERI